MFETTTHLLISPEAQLIVQDIFLLLNLQYTANMLSRQMAAD
jgi:hypothetical protein